MVKNSLANAGVTRDMGLSPPVLLPGKFHGQRNFMGYSPWGLRIRHD